MILLLKAFLHAWSVWTFTIYLFQAFFTNMQVLQHAYKTLGQGWGGFSAIRGLKASYCEINFQKSHTITFNSNATKCTWYLQWSMRCSEHKQLRPLNPRFLRKFQLILSMSQRAGCNYEKSHIWLASHRFPTLALSGASLIVRPLQAQPLKMRPFN